jgi:serine/threonine protein kinase
MLPARVGPYEVIETLGTGGTGVVVRGFRADTGASAAVKFPHPSSASQKDALRREIGVLLRVNRLGVGGVVRILEHGYDGNAPWYAMELLQGSSLRRWQHRVWQLEENIQVDVTVTRTVEFDLGTTDLLRATPHPAAPRAERAGEGEVSGDLRHRSAAGHLERVLRVVWRLAHTLAKLHAAGIVHGDLSPSNVIILGDSDPVLIDFGASLVPVDVPSGENSFLEHLRFRGTLGYTAPEIACGDGGDSRGDVYGLGCILHELLTGAQPFVAEEAETLVRQQLAYVGVSLRKWVRDCPDAIDRLVQQLLVPDPTYRVVRAEDICRALGPFLSERPPAPQPKAALYRPRLAGRDGLLADVLERHRGYGARRVILISGSRGSGKTRVLDEIERRASQQRVQVFRFRPQRSRQSGSEAALPNGCLELFNPILTRILKERNEARVPAEREMLDGILRRLEPLVPGLRGDVPRRDPILLEQTLRRQALEAVAEIFARLARGAPVILLVDDLEWVDELSLAFLREHATAKDVANGLLVATTSVEGVGGADLGSNVERLVLPKLSTGEIRAIAKDMLGAELLPEGLAELLDECSEAKPLLVVESIQAMAARGVLVREDGLWNFTPAAAARHITAALGALYEDRTAGVSVAARAALSAASVFDGNFDVDAFCAVRKLAEDPSEMLEELVAHGVLDAVAPGRYDFANEQLRAAEEAALPPAERAEYHRRAAEHYERIGSAELVERAASLGYHWALAGEVARAASYYHRAARAAESTCAWHRASELYRGALECTTVPEQRVRLCEALADVLLKQARHVEARSYLDLMLREAQSSSRLERGRAHRKLAASAWTVHEYATAKTELELAEQELGSVDGHSDTAAYYIEVIQVRLGRCQELYFGGQAGHDLDKLVRELSPLIDNHGTPDQRTSHYLTVASSVLLRGRYRFDPEAVALARKGLDAAACLPVHRQALAHLIVGGALMLGSLEDVRVAVGELELAEQHAAVDGEATLMARIRIFQAMTLLRTGDLERTAMASRRALESAECARLGPYIAAARGCLGWVAWRKNDERTAEPLLRDALDKWRAQKHNFPFRHFVLLPLLEFARGRDDHEAARIMLLELKTGALALPDPIPSAIDAALSAIDTQEARKIDVAIQGVLRHGRANALF